MTLGSPLAGELSPPQAVTVGVNVVEKCEFCPNTSSDLAALGHLSQRERQAPAHQRKEPSP